jgi:predicted nucleic acid-binding protein
MLESKSSRIIFDETVLHNFSFLQSIYVLSKLYKDRAFVCKMLKDKTYSIAGENWLQLPDIDTHPNNIISELKLAFEYNRKFGIKESESMAIAKSRNWIFATDDKNTRGFSKNHNIKITGSLGILIKAKNYQQTRSR